MDAGPEDITDTEELAVVRRQARSIHAEAALIAGVVAVVAALMK